MTVKTIKFVGVAGSGTMGAGIAEVAARAGFEVVLRSRSQAGADKARGRVAKSLERDVEKGKLGTEDCEGILSRLRLTTDLDDFGLCDLVIESVVEDLDTKRKLFAAIDRRCGEDAVLATNTSTLGVAELAAATRRPQQVVGTHFFNPATKMPLVEIVRTDAADAEAVELARRFAEECGKQPVTVKDRAGFIVNALLFPYLNTAVAMLERGTASKEDIDAAMRGGTGVPMGPFELLDLIGIDTSVAALEALHADQGNAATVPARTLQKMVDDGKLGKKSGEGFYRY
jgi:3-hydroxybutyryl-CoA dehydrogenase